MILFIQHYTQNTLVQIISNTQDPSIQRTQRKPTQRKSFKNKKNM